MNEVVVIGQEKLGNPDCAVELSVFYVVKGGHDGNPAFPYQPRCGQVVEGFLALMFQPGTDNMFG
jgi:hypothetical protein